jgi:undecaprenyl-diphosphatase
VTTTAPDEQRGQLDPVVAAPAPSTWQRWLADLARSQQQRVAGFGLVVLLGLLAGLAAIYVFTWLASEVLEHETNDMDTAAATFTRQWQSPTMDVAARTASLLGSEIVFMLVVALVALFAYQRRWGAAALLVLVTAGAQMLNNVLKSVYERARPEPVASLIAAQTWSFPSGHTMVSAAFYIFLAYLGWRLVSGWLRWLLVIGLVLLVLLIGLSRIYLQAHYLSDVIGGYVAGFIWTDAVIIGGWVLATRRTLKE